MNAKALAAIGIRRRRRGKAARSVAGVFETAARGRAPQTRGRERRATVTAEEEAMQNESRDRGCRRLGMAAVAALTLSLAPVVGAAAATLGPGMRLPPLALTDQHDAAVTLGPEVRLVLFTRDMDAADIVKEALVENGAALLEGAHAVTISDISRMPGVITRLFALPAMRKRPYRMILDRDGAPTAELPSEEGKVTVLVLEQGRIERVEFIDGAAALRARLEAK